MIINKKDKDARLNPERIPDDYDALRAKTDEVYREQQLDNPRIEFSDPNLIPGGGVLNPTDPTGSTMYTGNEFDIPKEEPMKDFNEKARHEEEVINERNVDHKKNHDKNPLEKAKDWVEEKIDDVKHDKKKDDVHKKYKETENKVQDTATDAKHEVEEKAEKAARRVDNAGEPLEDAQNWAGDRASEVKHGVGKAVDKVKNRTDD